MPSKKKKEESAEIESEVMPSQPVITEEEARTSTASSTEPVVVVSSIDRSLITIQGPLLSREQINGLRRKLKAKFH